jgi:hypothetical protein
MVVGRRLMSKILVEPDAIEPICRANAQDWLQRFFQDTNRRYVVEKTFQQEVQGDSIRAFPEDQRLYFIVSAKGQPELLAGIHPPTNGISSILKIPEKEVSITRGRDCVRKLIENVIVPRCKSEGQPCFSANTFWSDDGTRVFRWLEKNMPQGIVYINQLTPGTFTLWLSKPDRILSPVPSPIEDIEDIDEENE